MSRHRTADGFTLIEVVVVVSMMGLVAAVLAAVFTTVIRTAPATEDRIDDARSLLGITTWLPRDVGSTAPDAFRTGNLPSSCAGVPTSSQGLLELQWSELGSTLVADYRFVTGTDGTGTVIRYACALGGPASSLTMTAPLIPMPTGASPAPSEFPAPVDITTYDTDGRTTGVRFEIVVLDDDGVTTRSLLALDADTANVMTTLPPTTTIAGTTTTTTTAPPGNLQPVAGNLFVQVQLDDTLAGITLPAVDGDGDPLDATITATAPLAVLGAPPGITVSIEAVSTFGAVDGGTYSFTYTVSDGTASSNVGTVTVHVDDGGAPGTTTTTSTTTTTTLPPCSADFVSVSPNSVGVKNNGFLDDPVTVTITTGAGCGPLVLSFDPDTTDANTTPQQIAFNAGTTITIAKNAYVWRQAGPKPWNFTLELREGANGAIVDTTTLTLVAS